MSLLTVDGCNSYTVLSEADRAQGHIVVNASNYRCDRNDLVPGWYRFQGAAGDRMADKCVPENHCGSRTPGWLSGPHPSITEGMVARKACFSSSYSCCFTYQHIRIRNCGAYFVYELPRLYTSCPARYCGNESAGEFLRILLIIIWQGILEINKTVLVDLSLVGPDFAIRTASMETVISSVFVAFRSRQIESKYDPCAI